MSKPRNKSWLALLVMGILLVAIGVLALVNPLSAYFKMVKYSGIILVVNAIFLTLVSPSSGNAPKEKKWLLAESVIDFVFGTVLLFNPLFSFLIYPYLIGPWIFAIGVIKVLAATDMRKRIRGWFFILLVGILCLVSAVFIIYDPFSTASGIPVLIGIFGLILGATDIAESFRYRRRSDSLNMMI